MRHATPAALDRLEPLLARLRQVDELKETSRGVFSRRSKAFLHFHEDPSGVYADARLAADFERMRVEQPAEQDALLAAIRCTLAGADA